MDHEKARTYRVRVIFILGLLAVLVLTGCGGDDEKEEKKSFTVGAIMPDSTAVEIWDSFKVEMAAKGYIEGENITYFIDASGDLLVQQVPASNLDLLLVIRATFRNVSYSLFNQARTVAGDKTPLLMALGTGDPVAAGAAESLVKPGKNITGVLLVHVDTKRFELFSQMLHPGAQSIAVIYDPNNETGMVELEEIRSLAEQAGLELVLFATPGDDPEAEERAFAEIPDNIGGVFLLKVWGSSTRWYQWAYAHQVPTSQDSVLDATLPQPMMAYGPIFPEVGVQAARLADQIFKGTRPGDLPFEYADLRLTLDLNVAEAIGIELPDAIIGQAQDIRRGDLSVYIAPTPAPAAEVIHPEGTGACAAVQTSMGGVFKVCVTMACDDLLDSPMLSHSDRVDVGGCAAEGTIGVCAAANYDTTYYEGDPNTLRIGCGFMQGNWTASETSAGG